MVALFNPFPPLQDRYSGGVPNPEAASSNPLDRLTQLLRSAVKPVPLAQLKKASRLADNELNATLEAALAQSLIYRWPDYRKSQRFWSKSADESARNELLAIAEAEALSRAALVTRACAKVPGFSKKGMDRIAETLLSSKELQRVPAFTSGTLLIRAGIAAPYRAAARKFVEAKFRKAGLPLAPDSPSPTPSGAPQMILDLLRSIEPISGVPVTTQRLRQRLPSLSKEVFDAAALELRRRHEVSFSLHHDPYNLPAADRDLLIDGRDGNFYVAIAIRG
jgi:hypothetical protein